MDEKPTKDSVKVTNEPAPSVTVGGTETASAPQPQVQYVKMEKSVQGVGGWLLFWLIIFAFGGIGFIYTFFLGIAASNFTAAVVPTLIFAPLLAIAYLGTVV